MLGRGVILKVLNKFHPRGPPVNQFSISTCYSTSFWIHLLRLKERKFNRFRMSYAEKPDEITKDEWMEKLNNLHIQRADMNRLIMNYLVTEGFKEAAEKFRMESGIEPSVDLETLDERIKIREMILKGQIQEAIALINSLHPELLDTNRYLYFHLQMEDLHKCGRLLRREEQAFLQGVRRELASQADEAAAAPPEGPGASHEEAEEAEAPVEAQAQAWEEAEAQAQAQAWEEAEAQAQAWEEAEAQAQAWEEAEAQAREEAEAEAQTRAEALGEALARAQPHKPPSHTPSPRHTPSPITPLPPPLRPFCFWTPSPSLSGFPPEQHDQPQKEAGLLHAPSTSPTQTVPGLGAVLERLGKIEEALITLIQEHQSLRERLARLERDEEGGHASSHEPPSSQ
uniref:Glucose-induced degradation protein 8 homolog isoform X2 n=1 Tax=Geotrypetes seraphini TaxID=260995 RepID=A0A6P8SKH1_GEOSA|nr:glucose-induced degradation protein 8 homolog isoform X2 [Geotrypetes seraphini]